MTSLNGRYFAYCQWCQHDGRCELRHCDFAGGPALQRVADRAAGYPGHENLAWHFSMFQAGTARACCTRRIRPTSSPFFPLVCECGTVIDGMCRKFLPTRRGRQKLRFAHAIVQQRGGDPRCDLLTEEELAHVEAHFPNRPSYVAAADVIPRY